MCESTVSLSAIDTRVYQLKSGNEVLFQDVRNAIYPYEWSEYLPWDDRYVPPYEYTFRVRTISIV
jgi:hypothetical protein